MPDVASSVLFDEEWYAANGWGGPPAAMEGQTHEPVTAPGCVPRYSDSDERYRETDTMYYHETEVMYRGDDELSPIDAARPFEGVADGVVLVYMQLHTASPVTVAAQTWQRDAELLRERIGANLPVPPADVVEAIRTGQWDTLWPPQRPEVLPDLSEVATDVVREIIATAGRDTPPDMAVRLPYDPEQDHPVRAAIRNGDTVTLHRGHWVINEPEHDRVQPPTRELTRIRLTQPIEFTAGWRVEGSGEPRGVLSFGNVSEIVVHVPDTQGWLSGPSGGVWPATVTADNEHGDTYDFVESDPPTTQWLHHPHPLGSDQPQGDSRDG